MKVSSKSLLQRPRSVLDIRKYSKVLKERGRRAQKKRRKFASLKFWRGSRQVPDRNKFSYLGIFWTWCRRSSSKKKNKGRRKIKIVFPENINKAFQGQPRKVSNEELPINHKTQQLRRGQMVLRYLSTEKQLTVQVLSAKHSSSSLRRNLTLPWL